MNSSNPVTNFPARPIRKIHLLMTTEGKYLWFIDGNSASFTDSPLDALKNSMAWLGREVADQRLKTARCAIRDCPPLSVATVFIRRATPEGWELASEEDYCR